MPNSIGKHAVVIGAGIGGLTAAKALSSYFDLVTSWIATLCTQIRSRVRHAPVATSSRAAYGRRGWRCRNYFPTSRRRLNRRAP